MNEVKGRKDEGSGNDVKEGFIRRLREEERWKDDGRESYCISICMAI